MEEAFCERCAKQQELYSEIVAGMEQEKTIYFEKLFLQSLRQLCQERAYYGKIKTVKRGEQRQNGGRGKTPIQEILSIKRSGAA